MMNLSLCVNVVDIGFLKNQKGLMGKMTDEELGVPIRGRRSE
jgi:hypothetical protein